MELKEWLGEDNQIGHDIWTKKYQYNNETLDEWFERVSGGDEDVKQLIKEKKFLFGGRVLANRGIKNAGNYYNCFSGGYVPDDYSGILDKCKEIGITFKNQGGQGLSLSKLRPKGTPIGSLYEADGITGFIELFNCVTDKTSQGGARKGALMLSIDIRHKEAEDFITIKANDDKITRANLSLEIDDNFMETVQRSYDTGFDFILHERRNYSGHIVEYDICPIKLYKKMMQVVYDWGEPGCIFTNMAKNYNLLEFDDEYEIATTNPCGEQPLKNQTCCNLGSLNLYEFIENKFTPKAYFDWIGFEAAVEIAANALDNIIDENSDRLPKELKEYKKNAKKWRNIGLGVFNYAHALIALGLTYGSSEALEFTEELFVSMAQASLLSNMKRGEVKGCYPEFKTEAIIKSHYFKLLSKFTKISKGFKLRNCTMLSIAPTGSIATMLGGSGGIEPEFQFEYIRKTDNLKDSYKIESKIVKDFRKVYSNKSLPEYFVSSDDISWKDRINTQSMIQKYIDTAISSTINLPNTVTRTEIEQLYLYAWKKKLKGVTIYRKGCKRNGILIKDDSVKESLKEKQKLQRGYVIPPNDNVIGFKKTLKTGCGTLHCEVFFDANTNNLVEVYLNKGSAGGCNNFMVGLSRMISVSARGGIPVADIVDQLMSAGTCPSYYARKKGKKDTSRGSSCPVAVGYAIKELWEDFQGKELILKDKEELTKVQNEDKVDSEPKCPQCGDRLIFEGGCNTCKNCGWSKCE